MIGVRALIHQVLLSVKMIRVRVVGRIVVAWLDRKLDIIAAPPNSQTSKHFHRLLHFLHQLILGHCHPSRPLSLVSTGLGNVSFSAHSSISHYPNCSIVLSH